MDSGIIVVVGIVALIFIFIIYMLEHRSGKLNNIKSRKVGDGQYGTAFWASTKELENNFVVEPYKPDSWRQGKDLPTVPGLVISGLWPGTNFNADDKISNTTAYKKYKNKPLRCRIDPTDSHTLLISTTGGGKTTAFLYPNLERCCACGLSFFTTDTKGDIPMEYAGVAKKYYGYNNYIIDLRDAAHSHCFNLMQLTNKYSDLYYKCNGGRNTLARAERYAKVVAKTIINMKGLEGAGANAYFYDAAEGLITAVILLVAELCNPEERHIVSVFKLINELMEIDPKSVPKDSKDQRKPKNYFQQLMQIIPNDNKAKWFAGAALNAPQGQMTSVITTAMSRLLSFIDSEIEQIICFDSPIDAEYYCKNKTAVYLVFPENDVTKHFMVSLFINQFYNECIEYANMHHNKLDKRTYFFLDEVGTIPKIDAAAQMFSAGRSRGILQVPMIQSLAQLDKNYGRDESKIIQECCQNVLFGGLTPLSSTAKELSQMLGNQTVQSGSVSKGKTSSTSYQMHSKPLMSEDEIKRMPKYNFVFQKTGLAPFKTKLRRSPYWGINPDGEKYQMPEGDLREVHYATRDGLLNAAKIKYGFINNSEIETKRTLSKDLF